MSAPYQLAELSFSEAATRSMAKRLRRERQKLGSDRHNLLVSMRMINTIEREVIRAEWENWLLDENSRCRQAGNMLREDRTTGNTGRKNRGSQQVLNDPSQERMDTLISWNDEYCGSCKMELDTLRKERKHLTFV